jgi:hypothetical protein
MRFGILSWLCLAFACNGICQFFPYTGPTVVYPNSYVTFSLEAQGADEYYLLAAPTNTYFSTAYGGRGGETDAVITWQTPPRSAVGNTNQFVVQSGVSGDPTLSATCVVSFVVIDLPLISSLAMSNGFSILQFTNPLPIQPLTVQWADALPTTNWLPLNTVSGSSSITVTDTNPPGAQRFYRLVSIVPFNGWCYGADCP